MGPGTARRDPGAGGRVYAPVGLATHYHTLCRHPRLEPCALVMTDAVGAHFLPIGGRAIGARPPPSISGTRAASRVPGPHARIAPSDALRPRARSGAGRRARSGGAARVPRQRQTDRTPRPRLLLTTCHRHPRRSTGGRIRARRCANASLPGLSPGSIVPRNPDACEYAARWMPGRARMTKDTSLYGVGAFPRYFANHDSVRFPASAALAGPRMPWPSSG